MYRPQFFHKMMEMSSIIGIIPTGELLMVEKLSQLKSLLH